MTIFKEQQAGDSEDETREGLASICCMALSYGASLLLLFFLGSI